MANGIYYVDDYSGNNDNAKIAAAINAANNAGGGKVVLSNRTYNISQSIVLHRFISFCGVGVSSSIVCSTDVPIIQINRTNEDSSFIEICDMTMSYQSMNSSNRFHIEADRPVRLQICNVIFNGPGRVHSGVLTWDASSNNITQKISATANNAAFMTHIENCVFACASIWLNDSDSRIINNYIWGNTKDVTNHLDYAIRLSNGTVNIFGNDIVAGNDSGIYLASTCDQIRIENNYFDGSWENVSTGWGISLNASKNVLILGNTFNCIYRGGVLVSGASEQVTISKNVFSNINRSGLSDSHYDIKIFAGNERSFGHIIEGNQHRRDVPLDQNLAVFADTNAEVLIVNNSLVDSFPNIGAYGKPPFYKWTDKYSIRENNRVSYYTRSNDNPPVEVRTFPFQFDEGQIAVSHNASTQTVDVTFALDFSTQNIVPKVQDIHLNFVGAASNSSVVYTIWGITNTGFKINVRPVDANSSSSGVFCWRVSLQ